MQIAEVYYKGKLMFRCHSVQEAMEVANNYIHEDNWESVKIRVKADKGTASFPLLESA